jgi:hypothetical protein
MLRPLTRMRAGRTGTAASPISTLSPAVLPEAAPYSVAS